MRTIAPTINDSPIKLLIIKNRTPIIITGNIINPIISRIKQPATKIENLKKTTIIERLTTANIIAIDRITISSNNTYLPF